MYDLLITITHSDKGLIETLLVKDGNLLGWLATAQDLASTFERVYGGTCRVEVKA